MVQVVIMNPSLCVLSTGLLADMHNSLKFIEFLFFSLRNSVKLAIKKLTHAPVTQTVRVSSMSDIVNTILCKTLANPQCMELVSSLDKIDITFATCWSLWCTSAEK